MNDHYYTQNPSSESRPATAEFDYHGHSFALMTDTGVFSRGELDSGTRILLSALPYPLHGEILDLGCGWGAVGISVGYQNASCHVTSTDVNLRALALCKANAEKYGINASFLHSDGFENITGSFDFIITNPPIRAGKQTIYQMFADSASHLKENGALYLVIRKQQGAPSAQKYLQTLFTNVTVIEKSGGYWVICCQNGGTNDEI